jgi:hypothetical protein
MEESGSVSRWSFQAEGRYIRPIRGKRRPPDRGKAPPLLKVKIKINVSFPFSISITFIEGPTAPASRS